MVGGTLVFYRVRRLHGKYYLIKEWYDDKYKKKRSKSLGNCETIEKLLEKLNSLSPEELDQIINTLRNRQGWCGGWDLNPRRPTPSGPEPDPFDQARAPPHELYLKVVLAPGAGFEPARPFTGQWVSRDIAGILEPTALDRSATPAL